MIHINTKDPVTSPKDSETKENYTTDDPRTTKKSDTIDLGTTEVHTTADPGMTQKRHH